MGTSFTTTNNAFRYPTAAVGEAPDPADDIHKLALDLDGFLGGATWTPGIGGTGAGLGTSGSGSGYVSKTGRAIKYNGVLKFGTSGSLGSGVAAVTGANAFGNQVTDWSMGFGWWEHGGANPVHLTLVPSNGSQFLIFVTASGNPAYSLGTPVLNDAIHFVLEGVLA